MLVISRKTGESVILSNNSITVTVVNVKGRQVRLGIAAPSATAISRPEMVSQRREQPLEPISSPVQSIKQLPPRFGATERVAHD